MLLLLVAPEQLHLRTLVFLCVKRGNSDSTSSSRAIVIIKWIKYSKNEEDDDDEAFTNENNLQRPAWELL